MEKPAYRKDDTMKIAYYVVRVWQDENEKFLFNRRTLVNDIALARHFSDLTPAHRYVKRSIFLNDKYSIDPVPEEEPPIDRKHLGAIVE